MDLDRLQARLEPEKGLGMRISPAASVALLLLAAPAAASSSDWFEAEGARLRLVTSGVPDAEGRLRGALEIVLDSGWKTYWSDPGDSGVPPALQITGALGTEAVRIGFPVPKRFDEGLSSWTGYDRPVALALTLEGIDPGEPLNADLFIGLCETICIPVAASLTLTPDSEAYNPQHAAVVSQAFSGLPQPADDATRVEIADIGAGRLTLEAIVPAGVTVKELFLDGVPSLAFGKPELVMKDDGIFFEIEYHRAGNTEGEAEAGYTLVTDQGAVAGTIVLDHSQ